MIIFAFALLFWLGAWAMNVWLVSRIDHVPALGVVIPIVFGLTLLLLWEATVFAFDVPTVLLPAPRQIITTFFNSTSILWEDLVQTVFKGALTGYVLGCGAAFVTAVLIERSDFLKAGILPVGNFVAALPVIGLAPILVMWFGFDWQSKAAVVVAMVYFPMLVNTVQGLQEANHMQRDLMRTYASGPWVELWRLRLPTAMPFIFNGLKIASTLALIGAIVAEFFGSPVKGMGFRISTSVGQLNLPLVWAEILVAAIVGTSFYGVLALIERRLTFWHPSQRGRA